MVIILVSLWLSHHASTSALPAVWSQRIELPGVKRLD